MADQWRPRKTPIDGRYLWLPIRFSPDDDTPVIEYSAEWSLSD